VPLADFSRDALEERLRDASALEAIARRHNRVIEAIHERQAILPARFGTVYASARDVMSALGSARDTLLSQLVQLDGCDEWAVHLYADSAVVRERVTESDPAIRLLRDDCVGARPGRAYFLTQQLRAAVQAATRQEVVALAQRAFDRIADNAVAGTVNPVQRGAAPGKEEEILRASFLVARDRVERFEAAVVSCADTSPVAGLRGECTGPWPPYSFAVRDYEARS
jgi:hypothetical protein